MKKKAKKYIDGTLSVTAKGIGYVTRSGEARDRDENIEIPSAFLNTGLDGDTVRVLLHPKIPNVRQTGEVVKILSRAKTTFAGVLERGNGYFFLIPQDPKMYTDIFIPQRNAKNAKNGQKVVVQITRWNDPKKNPEGKVIKILGRPGNNDVEMEAIVLDRGLATDFPTKVKAEAEKIKQAAKTTIQKEAAKRRDFRDTTTFTIDPKTAKDFDDAISFKKLNNEDIEVGVHIADVSTYVKKHSALDREAAKRATSIYLVDRTIPMLPEELSDDICSLKPEEDRLAFSAVFTFSKGSALQTGEYKITKQWFGETVIRSDKRFSYEEAQEVLDKKKEEFFEELSTLNTIAYKLRKEKFNLGAISLETQEVEFVLDKDGKPIDIIVKKRGDTHKMIEEFMLLANRRVAEYASKKTKDKGVFVYRVHPKPDPEKITQFIEMLRLLGYRIQKNGDTVTSKDINAILLQAAGTNEETLIQTLAVRSMAKAIYSTKNVGHFGLAFKYYTHFTSPIRRYPDIMVHRILKELLSGKKVSKEELQAYENASLRSSEMEQVATKAERESVKYKQAEYMKQRIGKTFTGVISGITQWGVYVEEEYSKSEGMVRISEMDDDYYIFDEKTGTLIGKNTKKKYRIGDKVKIKVKNADPERRIIDYVFV